MNRTGSTILHGLLLATSGLVGSTLLASTAAMAGGGPTGGKVVVGSATITNASPTQTVVNQSSKKALINWNSFSIPGGSSVKFNQPNNKSLAVNRVTGPNASIIEGQLLANGSVWLINANGVLFGKGSQINVGALLATTSDLSDDDFKSGKYNFKPAANPNAAVVNKGTITAGANGSVVLSAPRVSNEGLIQANLGTVVLGGASAFTVDMTGDNLLRYQITAPVANAPKDANGSVASALVSNSGTILAAGGQVMMTARAARNVEDNVINNTGMVEATTVSSHNGVIDLDAGPDGTVNDSGTLNATGMAQGQTGGTVNVTGGTVNVADGAKIDASGNAGGGTIQIGGGLHGQGTLAHAQRTIIGKATIAADATGKGNGGTVAVWSDGQTSFAGSISAKGGTKGGNGGQVETSGHNLGVAASATVDTSAPLGLTGDWLLDPVDLVITSCVSSQFCCGTTTCVDSSSIAASLSNTDVTQTATNSLTLDVNSDITWNSINSLNLLSEGDIDINSSIQNAGTGGINIIAGWDGSTLSFSPTMASTVYGGGVNGVGNISVASAGSGIAVGSFGGQTILAGHDIQLQSNSGNVQIGYQGAGGGEIDLLAAHNLGLTTNATSTMVRVGNGGTGTSGAVQGDINIQADAIDLSANATQTSIIIGNAGAGGVTGEINITANGALTLTQTAINSETVIGNGDLDVSTTGAVGGNVTVTAGSVAMTGNVSAQANIGNRGVGTVSGNLDIETTNGDLSLTAQNRGLAAIGNRVGAVDGANLVTGSASGDIIVGSTGKLTITANDSGQARIATGFAANSTIQVNADGDISLAVNGTPAQAGDGSPLPGQALIGNFGNGLAATIGGDITVTSAHGKIDLDVEENGGYIGVGNIGGTTSTTGNVSVSALDGSGGGISLTANAGVATGNSITLDATIQIGNAAGSGAVSGGVTVSSDGVISLLSEGASSIVQIGDTGVGGGAIDILANGTLSVTGGAGNGTYIGSLAQIGNGGTAFAGGNVTGDITIHADGVYLGANGGIGAIGNIGGATSGSQSGDITIVSTGDIGISTSPGAGASVAQIGNWSSVGTSGGAAGAIDLTADGQLYLDAYGDGSQAIVGNGGRSGGGQFRNQGQTGGDITITAGSLEMSAADNSDGAQSRIGSRGTGVVSGDIDIGTTIGGISMTAEDADFVSIGHGVGTSNGLGTSSGSSDGSIEVQSASTLAMTGHDSGQARIGNGQAANSQIDVTAAGDISLTVSAGSALSQLGLASIGNFGNFTKPAGGDITVTSTGGSIDLKGYEDGALVLIGNGSGSTATTGEIHVSALDGVNGSILLDASGDDALVQIGNNSPSGTIGGDVTVEAGYLLTVSSGGSGSVAQIGNGAPYQSGLTGGNISGDIHVVSGGDLELSGAAPKSIAQIGNGDLLFVDDNLASARAGNVSGDITLNVAGNTDFNEEGGDYGQPWIGNTANGDDGYAETGNVTIITRTGYFFGDFLAADLGTTASTGGDVFVGFTDTDGSFEWQMGDYDSPHTFTIAAASSLDINGDIANSGSGDVNVIAGWDGQTTDLALLTDPTLANSTYGANQGAVFIRDVSVGSAGGKTTVAGDYIELDGSDGDSQIGYYGTGGGDIFVLSKTDIDLDAGIFGGGFAQIGNGGDYDQEDTGNTGNTGNINVIAGGSVTLTGGVTGGEGSQLNYAQIGNGGAQLEATASGDISVVAGDGVTLDGYDDYAQIGNGGADFWGDISGTVTVAAGGHVSLTNSGESGGYAQIGNGGIHSGGTVAGNINVSAGAGLDVFASVSGGAYAQIGNGGDGNDFSTNSGNIIVDVVGAIAIKGDGDYAQIGNGGSAGEEDPTGTISVSATGAISLSGGEGDIAYAQIGNGGVGTGDATSGDITVTSGGDLSLEGGSGDYAYAQIGNGGDSSSGNNSGNIVVTSGGSITLTGDTDYAQIGNGGWGTASSNGSVAVSAAGAITLSASDTADYGYAQIGNGGTDANGTIGGDVTISSGGVVSIAALYDGAIAEIGNMGGEGSSESGNISINTHGHALSLVAAGGDLNFTAAHIGNWTDGDAAAAGSSGNILITAGAVNLSATDGWSFAKIGNGDFYAGHSGTLGGNITVNASSLTLTADASDTGIGQARIGNLGDGTTTGNIVINTTGSISLIAADSGLVNIGGASVRTDTNGNTLQGAGSGDLTILAGGSVSLLAQTGGEARIESGGFTNGNVSVSATGDVTLAVSSNSSGASNGTAFIGSYATGNGAVNVSVASLNGKVVLNAADTGAQVEIGTRSSGLTGNVTGNVRVSAANATNGNITVSATGSGAVALIGNAGYGSTVSGNITVLAGNALQIVGDRQLSQTEGTLAQIGNTVANFSGDPTVSGKASGNVAVTGGTINGIEGSVLNDIAGGNVTVGVTKLSASVVIDDDIDYASANTLTILTAGNLTVSGNIQNSGTGNITLLAGWNPSVAPSSALTASGAYGNNNATITIGGSSAGGNSAVGSARGVTTILTKNLNVSAVKGTAELGYSGPSSGNIIVNATGNIAVAGKSSSVFAEIGNLGISNQAVSGNITIADAGSFTLTNGILGNIVLGNTVATGKVGLTAASLTASGASLLSGNSADITLTGAGAGVGSSGNALNTVVGAIAIQTNNGSVFLAAPQNALSIGVGSRGINLGSGSLTLTTGGSITQTAAIKAAAVNLSATSGSISLANAANAFGTIVLSAKGSATIGDASSLTVGNATVGGDLTLLSKGDLIFTKSIQLLKGALVAVAGWSGSGASVASGTYGNNGRSITIGGSGASGDVAVGSASGATTLAGADINLQAINGFAQIGYHGGGSGAINVFATDDVTLAGGSSSNFFAQIGDGGYKTDGTSNATISVIAGGDIALNGGAGQEAYAQIGHGGAESNSSSSGYSETGLVTVSGETVTLSGGSGAGSYAQIGHGGYKSGQSLNGIATLGGDIAVDAVTAIHLAGGADDAYAQIGHGGDFLNTNAANGSSGALSGNITVNVATPNTPPGGDPLTLTAGTGVNSYTQIGNGGQGENSHASGATVTFDIGGNVTVADLTLTGSNTGANGYAQIGNGDASKTGSGNVSGQVTLGSGTVITNIPGQAPGASVGLGNSTGFGAVTGTVLPGTGIDAGTQGSVASITQNPVGPTSFNITTVTVTPQNTPQNQFNNNGESQGPTPLEQLTDQSDSEGKTATDSVAESVGKSLSDGKAIYMTSEVLIPGMLKQIMTLTRNNPSGIPPADEDYSSWGNEALWRW